MYSDVKLSSTFLFMEDFHTFLFPPHFRLWTKPRSPFPSTFQFLEDFQTFLFLPHFSLWKISTIFFSSTFEFVEDFNNFPFLPHFSLWKISTLYPLPHISLWKISTLSSSFHISVCGRFPHRFPPSTYQFVEDFNTILFLPYFSLQEFPHFSFPSTSQFVQNFPTILFLPQFSLWNISTLFFYSFHISDFIAFLFSTFQFVEDFLGDLIIQINKSMVSPHNTHCYFKKKKVIIYNYKSQAVCQLLKSAIKSNCQGGLGCFPNKFKLWKDIQG